MFVQIMNKIDTIENEGHLSPQEHLTRVLIVIIQSKIVNIDFSIVRFWSCYANCPNRSKLPTFNVLSLALKE